MLYIYTRHNPTKFDEATGKLPNNIKTAFADELGDRYWMTDLSDGVRQYIINAPTCFDILELVKRKMIKCKKRLNHGNNFRNAMTGSNPEYEKMINYFDTEYEFMQWYGWIAHYLHAFRSVNAVEISNNGTLYDPLSINVQDTRNLSIANK